MSVFQEINAWIVDNQALVVSVGVPLVTLMVTGWASFLSLRAKVVESRLNGRVKLSEYRRANFEELLRLSGRLQSVFFETTMKNARDAKLPFGANDNALNEAIECFNLFLLRSNANLEQTKRFSDCFQLCISKVFLRVFAEDPKENSIVALRVICKEIQDHEWRKIVDELEGTAL